MNKFQSFLKSRANQFVLKIFLAYALWKALYYLLQHGPDRVTRAWGIFTFEFGALCAVLSGYILNAIGEANKVAGIDILLTPWYNWDMKVLEHCLAIPAMVIFTAVIIAFPGRVERKLWFIPLGIFLIFAINIVRLVFLCIVFVHTPHKVFVFFHTYIYVVITYGLILAMVMFWMRTMNNRPHLPG